MVTVELERFIKTSFQNVRSSKRTDELHKAIVAEFIAKRPDLSSLKVEYEYSLGCDGYAGTFKVDIAFVDHKGHIKVAILCKALNSNVNKNIKNYANCSVGEAARCMFALDPPDEVFFITVLPRQAPRFKTSGEVIGLDDVPSALSRTCIQPVLSAQYDGAVRNIYLFYDIVSVSDMTAQSEFMNIQFENLDEITYEFIAPWELS